MKKYVINILLFHKNKSIFLFLLLKIILCESDECSRDKPIKIGNTCYSTFCSKSQFNSGDCIISNSIIKNQWLNDIIQVGEKDFRYINFMTSSDDKMILYTSPYPLSRERIFYGIDSNANPIFKDEEGNNAYIIKKNVPRTTDFKAEETISGPIKLNQNGDINKEYLITIGKSETYTEIFDFENYNEEIIEIPYTKIMNCYTQIVLGNLINLKENDINYYYLTVLKKVSTGIYAFYLLKFNIIYDNNGEITFNKIESDLFNGLDKRIANCYTINNKIVCMYITDNKKYKIVFFDTNLNNKKEVELSIQYTSSSRLFFKLFHFKDELAIFTYYQGIDNDYPTVQLLETQTTGSSYSLEFKTTIKLNKYYSNNEIMLTDIIKLRENILSLASTTTNKETLIVVLINFYNNMDYNLRYYLVKMFELYKHKFLTEMKLHIYNQNLALAFSFCHQETCNGDDDEHFSSLIFFSYPNVTNNNINIVDYLNKAENNNVIANLANNAHIDNNIFGFILYGIKVYSIDDCGINFISNKTNKIIKKDDILDINENIIFEFINNDYGITNCSIVYNSIIKEPDYEEYNQFPNYILKNDIAEKNNFNSILYEGKFGYYNILITQDITKNCEEKDINCDLCLKNNKLVCLSCKYEYDILDEMKKCRNSEISTTTIVDEDSKESIKEDSDSKTTIIEIVDEETTFYMIKNCTIENIVKGKCPNILLTNEELKEVYRYIKKNIINKDYNQENLIIPTSQVFFQISTLEDQKNDNFYLSSIDLRDCENTLRQIYHIKDDQSLIIFKIDIANYNLSTTYVKYEIYESESYKQLNLTYCNNTDIIMNIPANLDDETISLYDRLNKYGYNLFDPNGSFYNDICTSYSSENDKDIILNDRKNIIYTKNGNKTLCQDDCTLKGYNSEYKKAICQCSAQFDGKEPDLGNDKMKFSTNAIAQGFFKAIKNSNFLVLKCYNLIFDLKNIRINIGMIIMTIILLTSIILIIFHYSKEKNKIEEFIESILKAKFFLKKIGEKKNSIKSEVMDKNKESGKKNNKKSKKLSENKNLISIYKQKSMNNINDLSIKENLNSVFISNKSAKKLILNNKDITNRSKGKSNTFIKKKNNTNFNNKTKRKSFRLFSLTKNNMAYFKKQWLEELKSFKPSDISKFNKLNDQELNTLEYNLAVENDKRTYIQYYWSLLKKKQLILFTFIPIDDYNLLSIKISLFLISFSLSFTINGFFFTDESMHKIYEDNKIYNFISQIAQILYSTVICTVVNGILKWLSLSETNILEIKKIKILKKAIERAKEIGALIKKKYIIFFIISSILLIFFWYFISCFCIVYNNTQIILIKDTLISFGLSMVYPFGLNLFPGLLRIPSLKANKKDKKCLYKISLLVALI